jgi:hypothetical protein
MPKRTLRLCGAAIAAGCFAVPAHAQTQQPRPQQKKTITLPALAAQGFEVKATIGSYLVLQNGKDVWFCYMLDTRSNCEAAE